MDMPASLAALQPQMFPGMSREDSDTLSRLMAQPTLTAQDMVIIKALEARTGGHFTPGPNQLSLGK